uniref:Uncharacterized protein n=1 Tax=Canis lupus dingo TaxID=286419 RepID=A0A8C0KFN1_CANLU
MKTGHFVMVTMLLAAMILMDIFQVILLSDSTKLLKKEERPKRVVTRVSKSGSLYELVSRCFNVIDPPSACHPIRFLSSIMCGRVASSFQGAVKSF